MVIKLGKMEGLQDTKRLLRMIYSKVTSGSTRTCENRTYERMYIEATQERMKISFSRN